METIRTILLLALVMGLMGCTFSNSVSPTTTPNVTETITPTTTQVPSAAFTLTPVVTLSPEQWAQQLETIQNMVNTPDDGCALPCWWGITPGKTTWAEAGRILDDADLAAFENRSSTLRSLGLKMYEVAGQKITEDDWLQLYTFFYVRDEIVDYIVIGDYLGIPSITWRQTWASLSPEKIIPELGIPSRVQIGGGCDYVDGYSMVYCKYKLYVYYDVQDILLKYTFITGPGEEDPVCPFFGDGGNAENWFKLILKSPDDETPIESYDEGHTPGVSFEVATGKTLEDFYQAFLQTDSPPCFNVLPDVFEP